MKVTLNIEESKLNVFLDFIKTLDYVSINKDYEIPQWQQNEVAERMESYKKGELKYRSWDDTKKA